MVWPYAEPQLTSRAVSVTIPAKLATTQIARPGAERRADSGRSTALAASLRCPGAGSAGEYT